VVLAPIAEEILMRGYLYTSLRAHWKFVPSLLVTSLLFGLAHLQSGDNGALIWMAALNTFLLSIALVYLREKTGALYASIMVHSMNNFLAFAIHFHQSLF
jgi:membrane protease YdiL (CAAX protease family)